MLHSPTSSGTRPRDSHQQRDSLPPSALEQAAASVEAAAPITIDAVSSCRLSPFWRTNPELWFHQAEAVFQTHRVRGDARFGLVIGALDQETIQDIADILRSPPTENKYEALKTAVITRLTDSSDRQIHKLLTQLELGDRKPSQLLRHMQSLAGGRVSDDVIRVKWLDLLPPMLRRLLKVFRATSLGDLATAADELDDGGPAIMATRFRPSHPQAPSPSLGSVLPTLDLIVAELKALRLSTAQLTDLTRTSVEQLSLLGPFARPLKQSLSKPEPEPYRLACTRSHGRALLLPSSLRFGRAAVHTSLHLHINYDYRVSRPAGKLIEPASRAAANAGAPTAVENRLHVTDRRTPIRFIIDSGSVVSLLPRSAIVRKLQRQPLVLHAANSSPIATYGRHTLTLDLGLRRDFSWSFIIADVQTAIIGADFLSHFGLLTDFKRRRLLDSLTTLSSEGTLSAPRVHSISTVASLNVPEGPTGQRYACLLENFAGLASPSYAAATLPDLPVQHAIMTTGLPVFERARRLTGVRLQAAKDEFAILLDRGIIRPSSSQWASPLHLVPKPNGTWRATGDYRRLNACTIPDRYPLSVIEDLLQELHGNVFTVIDLQRAFYQIPVAEEDIPKTAVTTSFGLFEFLGMPLGLQNSVQTLQRVMNHIICKFPFARCYVDDLIITS